IGFPSQRGYDEAPFARAVARRFGTEHREFLLEPDAVEILPRLIWHLDQPLADPSAIPLYYLSRMTREHVTVALAGDGGDELFGGYERYFWDQAAARYARLPAPLRRGVIEPLLSRLPHLPLDVRRDPIRRARTFVRHAHSRSAPDGRGSDGASPLPRPRAGRVGVHAAGSAASLPTLRQHPLHPEVPAEAVALTFSSPRADPPAKAGV